MNTHKSIIFLLLVFISGIGCSKQCDDCLELTTKSLIYIDSSGTNLLFGDEAIYDADSLTIRIDSDDVINTWEQEESGSIMFNIEPNYTRYYIELTDSIVDTLDFELGETKSELCCGNVTYTTKTTLNRQEIENNDIIIIYN